MAKANGNGGNQLVWIIGLGSLFFMGNRLLSEGKKATKKGAGFGGNAKDNVRRDLKGRVGPARQLYADPGSIQYEGAVSRRGRRDGSVTAKHTVRFKLKGTPYKRVAREDSHTGGSVWVRVNNVEYQLDEQNPYGGTPPTYDARGDTYTPRIDGLWLL